VAGTYYLYSNINDPKDGGKIATQEYSVRVYTASHITFQVIDKPNGFIESVIGHCAFKTCTLTPLVGNDIKYYYGWAANCGYLVMLYVNDSTDTTLSINTMITDYDKDGVIPIPSTLTPEGDHADIPPSKIKVYPMYWYLYKGCNAQISWSLSTSTSS